jgi:hypothetical protein
MGAESKRVKDRRFLMQLMAIQTGHGKPRKQDVVRITEPP